MVQPTQAEVNLAFTKLFAEHDAWERGQQEEVSNRLGAVEGAIVQINHFTKSIEGMNLPAWISRVDTNMGWFKFLLGAGALSGLSAVAIQLIQLLAK